MTANDMQSPVKKPPSARKVIVFGNSSAGKSTWSKKLASAGLAHLDLDTIAWDMNPNPVRKPLQESAAAIAQFIQRHENWVIEGCYADLLSIAAKQATEAIFLDIPLAQCLEQAKNRPWEPHKYPSKAAQDKNLNMLLAWIAEYPIRTDHFSRSAHQRLFEDFEGKKTRITQ